MEVFSKYINDIQDITHKQRLEEVLQYILSNYTELKPKIAWNQPMFTHHGTFIIAFSVSKLHLAVSPERAGMIHFSEKIAHSGYEQGKMIFRIKWGDKVDYALLDEIIKFNIEDKKDCKTFWRK